MNKYVEETIAYVREKHASEPEFVQTVEEVLSSLSPVVDKHHEQIHQILSNNNRKRIRNRERHPGREMHNTCSWPMFRNGER